MTDSTRPTDLLTVEEYLAFEETSSVRHEYVGGNIPLDCPPDTLLSFADIYRRIEFAP